MEFELRGSHLRLYSETGRSESSRSLPFCYRGSPEFDLSWLTMSVRITILCGICLLSASVVSFAQQNAAPDSLSHEKAVKLFLDSELSIEARLKAMPSIKHFHGADSELILDVLSDRKLPDEMRMHVVAVAAKFRQHILLPGIRLNEVVLSILRDEKDANPALRIAIVKWMDRGTNRFWTGTVPDVPRPVVHEMWKDPDSGVRLAAILFEAHFQEQATFDELLGVLKGKPSGRVTIHEATRGLTRFWDRKKVPRSGFVSLLDYELDEVRIMALSMLTGDPDSRAKRISIMNDPRQSLVVRNKVIETLRGKTYHWKDLWGIVERKTESSAMRTVAMQGLDIMLRRHSADAIPEELAVSLYRLVRAHEEDPPTWFSVSKKPAERTKDWDRIVSRLYKGLRSKSATVRRDLDERLAKQQAKEAAERRKRWIKTLHDPKRPQHDRWKALMKVDNAHGPYPEETERLVLRKGEDEVLRNRGMKNMVHYLVVQKEDGTIRDQDVLRAARVFKKVLEEEGPALVIQRAKSCRGWLKVKHPETHKVVFPE
jgi:hypothetical protein